MKPDAPGRRLGIYARVSTDDQDAAPQLERLREWADRHGYIVHMERADVATGRNAERPGLDDIMRAARGRHIHAVAVVKLDRWARSLQDLARTVAELHDLGVDWLAVDQSLHVSAGDATSRLTMNVLGSVAEWEASIISERTKAALAAKMAQGVKVGRPSKPCALCGGEGVETRRVRHEGRRVRACLACRPRGGVPKTGGAEPC